MTISTHLNIAGMDLTVEIITHNPQFADYNVLNTHTGSWCAWLAARRA
jgi:hypothetical protein